MREKKEKKLKLFNRFNSIIFIMLIIFICIISRLIYLQIFRYDYYTDKANTQARRSLPEKAPRGKIYDSNGNILADNKTVYNLTFTTTDDSSKYFYDTMKTVFKLLDERKDEQQDNFNLKLDNDNKPYFDFNGSSDDTKKAQEIRFKRDHGLNDVVKRSLPELKNKQELTDADEDKINQELLKINAEDTFNYLLKFYTMYDILNPTAKEKQNYKQYYSNKEIANELLKKYSIKDLRRFMIVKDAIKMQSYSGFKPVTIAYNIQKDSSYIFYQKLSDLPGIDISVEPMRTYPYATDYNLASGVIGYVSSIDSSKKDRYEEKGYDLSTDLIGKAGIESAFESVLKGNTGETIVKVNSQGRKTEELFKSESSPGQNVYLSINKNIQYSVDQTLKDRLNYVATQYVDQTDKSSNFNATRGAAIVLEAKTGRVLALSSYPGYDANIISDPNELTPEITKQYFSPDYDKLGQEFINKHHLNKTVDELFPKDKNGVRQDKYDLLPKPFYNYATMGLIPPGSTFKPLTSLAGLQEGVIDSRTTVNDTSQVYTNKLLGTQQFKDDGVHGAAVDIKKALAASCNIFYYETGMRLYEKNGTNIGALDSLAKYAWQLGMGNDPNSKTKGSTGIEIGESFGQTYNYQYNKEQTLMYGRFDLVESLEAGKYGDRSFVALDIANKDDDSDELKATKQKFKDYIFDYLKNNKSSSLTGVNQFVKGLDPLLDQLQKDSKIFSDNVKKYNESGKKYSNANVKIAIEQFIYNENALITTPAQLVLASIGQGVNNFSIVQIANYLATIVNGGTRYKVHLVDRITDSTGKVVQEFKPEVLNKIDINPTNLSLIKQGMAMANTDDLGTASSVFKNFPIPTGGKTGTATYNEQIQAQIGRSAYGVYISCAPINDPEIVVAVVMYDGAHGFLGADVAKAAYETYFKDRLQKDYPNYQPTFSYTFNSPVPDKKDDTMTK